MEKFSKIIGPLGSFSNIELQSYFLEKNYKFKFLRNYYGLPAATFIAGIPAFILLILLLFIYYIVSWVMYGCGPDVADFGHFRIDFSYEFAIFKEYMVYQTPYYFPLYLEYHQARNSMFYYYLRIALKYYFMYGRHTYNGNFLDLMGLYTHLDYIFNYYTLMGDFKSPMGIRRLSLHLPYLLEKQYRYWFTWLPRFHQYFNTLDHFIVVKNQKLALNFAWKDFYYYFVEMFVLYMAIFPVEIEIFSLAQTPYCNESVNGGISYFYQIMDIIYPWNNSRGNFGKDINYPSYLINDLDLRWEFARNQLLFNTIMYHFPEYIRFAENDLNGSFCVNDYLEFQHIFAFLYPNIFMPFLGTEYVQVEYEWGTFLFEYGSAIFSYVVLGIIAMPSSIANFSFYMLNDTGGNFYANYLPFLLKGNDWFILSPLSSWGENTGSTARFSDYMWGNYDPETYRLAGFFWPSTDLFYVLPHVLIMLMLFADYHTAIYDYWYKHDVGEQRMTYTYPHLYTSVWDAWRNVYDYSLLQEFLQAEYSDLVRLQRFYKIFHVWLGMSLPLFFPFMGLAQTFGGDFVLPYFIFTFFVILLGMLLLTVRYLRLVGFYKIGFAFLLPSLELVGKIFPALKIKSKDNGGMKFSQQRVTRRSKQTQFYGEFSRYHNNAYTSLYFQDGIFIAGNEKLDSYKLYGKGSHGLSTIPSIGFIDDPHRFDSDFSLSGGRILYRLIPPGFGANSFLSSILRIKNRGTVDLGSVDADASGDLGQGRYKLYDTARRYHSKGKYVGYKDGKQRYQNRYYKEYNGERYKHVKKYIVKNKDGK